MNGAAAAVGVTRSSCQKAKVSGPNPDLGWVRGVSGCRCVMGHRWGPGKGRQHPARSLLSAERDGSLSCSTAPPYLRQSLAVGTEGAETMQTLPSKSGWWWGVTPAVPPHPIPRQYLVLAGGQSRGGKGSSQWLKPPRVHPREGGGGELQEPGVGVRGIPSPFPIVSIPLQRSVVGHDGQSPQLAQLGVVLLLPLLIAQAGPVDLRRQVPKNLVHLRVVDNLGWGVGKRWRGRVALSVCVCASPSPPLRESQEVRRCPSQPLASAFLFLK